MRHDGSAVLFKVVSDRQEQILADWLDLLKKDGALETGRIKKAELETQCRSFLELLRAALETADPTGESITTAPLREMLTEMARSRALQGFSPVETANFVFSLKQPIFIALNAVHESDPKTIAQGIWTASLLLDGLGMHTIEGYQKGREEVIARQQQEISELSTPVVRLWDGVIALPLIGTLDSQRTQVVMENLLQGIVEEEAEIAIIDITGVPTVDTMVAQHLLKTVAAARLMGADCIISGIRPQIAQTMVHLGVELNVVSKATVADAFALALKRTGRRVVDIETSGRDRAGA